MVNYIPLHADYILVAVLLVGAALLLACGARLRRNCHRSAIGVTVLGALLLMLGLNFIRVVPLVDGLAAPSPVRSASEVSCGAMTHVAFDVARDGATETASDPRVLCPVQTVLVPFLSADGKPIGPSQITKERCWPRDAASTFFAPLCYEMGFLELDRSGKPITDDQGRRILGEIFLDHRTSHETYVIAFVHGWRHDASLGDPNVRSLRLEAAYAAAHLQERCRVANEHCGAKVFAIYISWPAKIGFELPSTQIPCFLAGGRNRCNVNRPTWADLSAVATFPSRKLVSDEAGRGILTQIDAIHDALSSSDHLLLIGHSLGGNALITGAGSRIRSALAQASAMAGRGDAEGMRRSTLELPADLTVLINPASEARKLIELRAAETRLFAMNPAMVQPRGPIAVMHPAMARGRFWPPDMPPRLLILSAICNEPQLKPVATNYKDPDICDTVVENAFPLSQIGVMGATNPFDRVGIGHFRRFSPEDQVASTHDVDVNGQRSRLSDVLPRTTYGGGYGSMFRCAPEPTWLLFARRRRTDMTPAPKLWFPSGPDFSGWDLGSGSATEKTLGLWAAKGAPAQSNIQFAYPGIADNRSKALRCEAKRAGRSASCVPIRALVQNSDPIWAVHANPSFMTTHNAFVSAPFFCALSKLVLDQPARDRGPPEQWVGADAADFRVRSTCAARKLPDDQDARTLFGSRPTPTSAFWSRCLRSGMIPG